MLPLTETAEASTMPGTDSTIKIENANHVHQSTTRADTAQFYHQSLFSPSVVTLRKAMDNHQLDSFPGLGPALLKHLPPSTATAKGHMHKNRKGIRSTKNKTQEIRDARLDLEDMNPSQQVCAAHEQNVVCYAALADSTSGTIYTDLPGPFPVRSIRNMQYIFVCYVYEANAILVRPMKSRSDACMVAAYKEIYEYLETCEQKPTLNVTDNEASRAVKRYIKSKNVDWQLVEPDNHRVNAAERAIQTFKNHFLAGLSTVDKAFPLQLWCYLLVQAEMTLNMLRTSRIDPSKSAYEVLEGKFDYNRTPLAPPGTKALLYEAAARRAAWAPHAVDGWYLGPAMHHYRCGLYFVTHTRATRIASSVKLYPTHCKLPTISEADETIIAAEELIQHLGNKNIQLECEQKLKHAKILQQLTAILKNAPPQRVALPALQRVDVPSTSNDTTAPRIVREAPRIHQRHTRRNTPMPAIVEETTCSNWYDSPRSPRREKNSKRIRNSPVTSPIIQPAMPSPTFEEIPAQGAPGPEIPVISQDDEVLISRPRGLGFPMTWQVPTPAPPRRSPRNLPRFQRANAAIFCAQEALYEWLAHAMETPKIFSPNKLTPATLSATDNGSIDLQEFCGGVTHPDTGETITSYRKLMKIPSLRKIWTAAMCKELGNISQGYGNEKGTNTVKFLTHEEIAAIPSDRTVTYARIVIDYREQKGDPNRVRITVGGNLINYPGELTTRTADLTTTKLMWNSVISTPDAKYLTADIKSFYLETPLDRFEYMKMSLDIIPQEFRDAYGLDAKAKGGFVYMEIQKGMYGLPQAGILANKLLKKRLAKHGYFEMPHTPGLWKHISRPISFTLVVDDFGIKYVGKQHAQHLLNAIKEEYTVEVDWEGELYIGIKLAWNYDKGFVDIAMPTYVGKQLIRYAHPPPKRKQHTPYAPDPVVLGRAAQDLPPPDDSPPLDAKGKKKVQQVVGSFLYYGRAIDTTILCALNELASQQANPTEKTMERTNTFLDYMATHPSAVIRYYASDMILNVHSDASYLTAPKARSRAGGHFFLGSLPKRGCPIKLNGAILTQSTILKCVAASAAEAELGALFLNAMDAKILRLTLAEMGHPQPPTPIHVDNSTAVGIVNNTIKRQRSRAMNMRYFWLLCQEAQRILDVQWHPGHENLGDFPSKNHNGAQCQRARPFYLHTDQSPRWLQRAERPSVRRGCVGKHGDPYGGRNPLPNIPALSRTYAAPAG